MASGSLSVMHTLGLRASLPLPCGSSSRNAACPLPCGESTTRKKLINVMNGPSAVSLRYMPGFSPDQSTLAGLMTGRDIVLLLVDDERDYERWQHREHECHLKPGNTPLNLEHAKPGNPQNTEENENTETQRHRTKNGFSRSSLYFVFSVFSVFPRLV